LHYNISETISRFGYSPESISHGSEKPVIFDCEFCLSSFESSFKSIRRNPSTTCSKCRSISAIYNQSGSVQDKHQFYLERRPPLNISHLDIEATVIKFGYSPYDLGNRSSKLIIADCEFCLSKFETKFCVITNRSNLIACKHCDAIASVYVRQKSDQDKHQFYLSKRPIFDISCLDIDATIIKFGYSPLNLSTYSAQKVIALCKYCKCPIELPMSKYSLRKGNITCWQHMRKKTIETLKDRYGVECTLDIPSVRLKLNNPKTEQLVESILKDRYKVDYVREHSIGPYSFDFLVPQANLLIECQGDYFHDFKKNGYSGTPKDRAKSNYIEKYTKYNLVWIFEHELHIGRLRKIFDHHIYKIIEPRIFVKKSKLIFRQIPNKEAHVFLSQYHYLGNLGTVATSIGAYLGSVLIAVCVFGGVTRNQSIKKVNSNLEKDFGPRDIRELRRFCIRPNIKSFNLASHCLEHSIVTYIQDNPGIRAILSFSDTSVDDHGTIYEVSKWKQLSNTLPSYHYLDPQTNRPIHKKTVWDMARSNHMNETEFAIQAGLAHVKEEPKTMWVIEV
jgi:hypothetical protein